jgi:aminobenzoyl-glutamate transport protein
MDIEKQNNDEIQKKSLFHRFLDFVEWLGNLLPHPVTLFALFALMVIVFSGIADYFQWEVIDPRPEGAKGRSADGIIRANSLMNAEGLRRILTNLVGNFTSFAPLGVVLVALLGVGVAERSGLITALVRGLVLKAASFKPLGRPGEKPNAVVALLNKILDPKVMVTIAICFGAVVSNTASEMGYVVLIPLSGVIFHSMGRHPLAGVAVAFACVSGGYSANLLIGTIDPLLAGLTQEAANIIAPDYEIHAAVNYYFMAISTFLITFLGAFVTLKIVEPKLGKYDPSQASEDIDASEMMKPLEKKEVKALQTVALLVLAMGAVVAWLLVPENGMLRFPIASGEEPNILNSAFFKGIVSFIFIFFVIPGFVYGRLTGSMKNDRDIIDGMAKSMSTLGLYIVIVFFAAQFVAFFNWTNLGEIIAVNGAEFLKGAGLTGPFILVGFICISGFVNLMLGSSSAQWAVTAPIFVPMLMLIGYSPEVIQAAYRIGDSVTNIVTPMMSYFALILAFCNKYVKNVGIGTIISMMIPYSIVFFVGWIILFMFLVFGLGMPVGPGAPTYFEIGN